MIDAIEIGARCSSASSPRSTPSSSREFEKVSREVETAFTEARVVAEFFGSKVDEVFGAEDGHLAKELQRLFGEGSTAAVQHQLRQIMLEQSAKMREDLLRQFSSADGSNPLADFKAAHCARPTTRRAARRRSWRRCTSRWSRSSSSCSGCSPSARRRSRSPPSTRAARPRAGPYEEAVAEAVDAIAAAGRRLRGGGRLRRRRRPQGRRVVDIDGCSGSARGRIVFEAKHSRKGRKEAIAELEEAMAQRSPTTASGSCPPRTGCRRAPGLREVGGDKLFVVYDPEDGSRLALEVAYSLARARVLMAKGGVEGLDAPALRAEVERALGAMEDVRRIKLHLTNAAGGTSPRAGSWTGWSSGSGRTWPRSTPVLRAARSAQRTGVTSRACTRSS